MAMILAFFVVAMPGNASAQLGTSGGLQLTPTSERLSLKNGDNKKIEFSLKNIAQQPAYVHATVLDFVADENGYPKYLDTTNSTFSARAFLQLPEATKLEPNVEQKYTVNVVIPEEQPDGVYYSSIIFSTSDTEDKPLTVGGVASTIVIEVGGGALSSSASILSLEAAKQNNQDSSAKSGTFFISGFNMVKIFIENSGETYIDPIGKITVYDPANKNIGSFEIAGSEPQTILPGSKRYIDIKTDLEISRPGPYTIEAIVGYSKDGAYIREMTRVWYVPAWLVLSVLVAALLCVVLIVRRHSHHHETAPDTKQEGK